MITKLIIVLMSLLSFFGCGKTTAPQYPCDTLVARDGSSIKITFFAHASLAIEWQGRHIYLDPVGEDVPWSKLPKADIILITHEHYDHFDMAVVEALRGDECRIVCTKEVAAAFEHDCTTMVLGNVALPFDDIRVEATPAYNISEGHTQFHPREREDCGYRLTLGGTTIYFAGDTEANDDVVAQRNIDVAFLPVNQPYTMTVEQAVRAVNAIKPTIFYPYHYGQVEEKTDIDALVAALKDVCEVRIRPME